MEVAQAARALAIRSAGDGAINHDRFTEVGEQHINGHRRSLGNAEHFPAEV